MAAGGLTSVAFAKWINWLLTRGRLPVLVLLVLISIGMTSALTGLTVEGDPRSMTSQLPEQQRLQQQLLDTFGNDETLFLSITPPQVLSHDGLSLVSEISARIGTLPGVAEVLSLSTAQQLVPGRYGAQLKPLLPDPGASGDWQTVVPQLLERNPHYQKLLLSGDGHSAGVLIRPAVTRSDKDLPQLIDRLRQMMGEYADQAHFHLTGVGVQKHDVAAFIQRDQQVVLPLVGVTLAVMLALIFRHISGVLLPLLATSISLIWTMGLYALAGYAMNTISSLLPPVVMILSISNAVHLYNGWLMLPDCDGDHLSAWQQRVTELAAPCFFTALTTALGLASLTVSSIPAVRQFGLFGAVGVSCSLVVSLTLIPLTLTFFKRPQRSYRRGKGLLGHALEKIATLTLKYPRLLLAGTLLTLLVAVVALPGVQNNTRLTGFFRNDAELAIASSFVDNHFGGINGLEFLLKRRDGEAMNLLADFRSLAAFEHAALNQDGVAKFFSVLPILRQLQRAENNSGKLALPDNQDDLDYLLALLEQPEAAAFSAQFISQDHKVLRLNLQLNDIGSREALAVINALQHSGYRILGDAYELLPTGSFYQVVSDSGQLVSAMLRSFGLSLLMVMAALLVLLRNGRLTLLALIPNLIPIIWALGVMGWLGIDLSTGTAMIGAVAFGLAVDDTIHYLVSFNRLQGHPAAERVWLTTTRVGRALVISTVILALGFWTGCFGSFKPTIYFSFLVGGTLCGALLCDLLVLPASLVLWEPAPTREKQV